MARASGRVHAQSVAFFFRANAAVGELDDGGISDELLDVQRYRPM
jgi:hypothetical protein